MANLEAVESFGSVDADTDELLYDAFEDHEAYQDVLNLRKFLILGNKGSGKTAIFKKLLALSEAATFSYGHTFTDYPWHFHNNQAVAGVPGSDRFLHSWKYLISISAAKVALNQDESLPCDDESAEALSKLERFVIDSYGSKDPDLSQIFQPSKKLKLRPNVEFDVGMLKAGVSPESVPVTELPTVIQDVSRSVQGHLLRALNAENKYIICFDQLDLGFDPASTEYLDRLISLLLAARDMNLAARTGGKRLFVAVFLRDDIFDALHFEDKNKLAENHVARIEWDTPRSRHTLKGLMERRFSRLLGERGSAVSWEDVFDEAQEMPSRQTKYRHILDRTYLRPRDIIKFSNATLSAFRRRVRGGRDDKFRNVDVHEARNEYSSYLVKELDDQLHKHLPHYEDYLEVLRGIGLWQFSKEQFAASFDAHTPTGGPADVDGALQQVFDANLVGYYRAGGTGGGSEYIFAYRDRTRFDRAATAFRTHPGLIEELRLKRSEGVQRADE